MSDKAAVSTTAHPRQPQKPSKSRVGAAAIPLIIFALIGVMFAVALMTGDPSKIPSALIGKPAPQIALQPLEGLVGADGKPVPGFEPARLSAGSVTVVNFWASWCLPCAQEHPLLEDLNRRTGVAIYGINYKDPGGGGRTFLKRLGNPYAAVGVDPNGRAAIEWGVYGMPETFVVDGKGIVVHKHVGPITETALETEIIPAIKAATRS